MAKLQIVKLNYEKIQKCMKSVTVVSEVMQT